MIKHMVLWKLTEQSKEEAPGKIKRMLEGLSGKIPGLLHIEVGINFNPNGYDVSLYSEFESAEALEGYQVHPEHQKVKDYIGSVTCGRAVSDYEV